MKLEDGIAHVHPLLLVGSQPKEGIVSERKLLHIANYRKEAL